ncbi:MAG: fibronectin type III domain-containing protein [Acidobacteria bacterium]|nr:fibronectin type III domain-containing protein [Acidobacteriota bacterium]
MSVNRLALTGTVAAILLCSACGGGSPSPAAPSAPRLAVAPSVTAAAPTAAWSTFSAGAAVVDLARCLSGVADAACFSGARPIVRVTTAGATAPGAPSGLTATSSGGLVTLTWSAPVSGDPVVTYIIEAGSAPGLSNLAIVTTNSTATTFSASGVGNGTYYVRIKAQNATGTSAASNEVTLVVGPVACTSAPGAPTSFATSVSGSTVTLTWNAPSGGCAPTSYILQAGSTAGSSALANDNVGNVTRFVATNVGTGFYYIRVVASNAFGKSAASNEVLTTVGNPVIPVDIQPRSFSVIGTIYGCRGGAILFPLTITAPPNVSWSFLLAPGSSMDPPTGSGSATVTLVVGRSAQVLPGPEWVCVDGDPVRNLASFSVWFSGGRGSLFVDLGYLVVQPTLLLK